MGNFTRVAWHPIERVARAAHYVDDHFGQHQYGVMFTGDDHVYRTEEVEIPLDPVLGELTKDGDAIAKGDRVAYGLGESEETGTVLAFDGAYAIVHLDQRWQNPPTYAWARFRIDKLRKVGLEE